MLTPIRLITYSIDLSFRLPLLLLLLQPRLNSFFHVPIQPIVDMNFKDL